MPWSPTASHPHVAAGVAFDPPKSLSTPNHLPFDARYPAHTHRYRRFIGAVTDTDARLAGGGGVATPSIQRTRTSCHLPVRLAVLGAEVMTRAGSVADSAGEVPLEAGVRADFRGRDAGCPAPPAQIRTCALTHTAPTFGG